MCKHVMDPHERTQVHGPEGTSSVCFENMSIIASWSLRRLCRRRRSSLMTRSIFRCILECGRTSLDDFVLPGHASSRIASKRSVSELLSAYVCGHNEYAALCLNERNVATLRTFKDHDTTRGPSTQLTTTKLPRFSACTSDFYTSS